MSLLIKNILQNLKNIKKAQVISSNLDELKQAGTYEGNLFTNIPSGAGNGYGLLVVIARTDVNLCQIYLDRATNTIFYRFLNSGSWQAWKKVTAV